MSALSGTETQPAADSTFENHKMRNMPGTRIIISITIIDNPPVYLKVSYSHSILFRTSSQHLMRKEKLGLTCVGCNTSSPGKVISRSRSQL